ncbi:MAG: CotH kinase family protein [Prevotella sp.]|nr:CotH kinase family protein [Prevotella sp.]
MRRLFVAFIFLMLLAQVSHAQITVDGRPAFYDSLTDSYLMSVPEDFDTAAVSGDVQIGFTHIPIIRLTGDFGNDYSAGTITLAQPSGELETYSMKAKYRGRLTNNSNRHKHNFHIKLLNDAGNKLNTSLLGLRKDNSYLLDAGQIDLGRIRNHVANEIWRDMGGKPYYAGSVSGAKSYVDCEFAELFINNEYFGLYSLTEAIDRKQMKLMEYEDDVDIIHGELIKTSGYNLTTMWGTPELPDNQSGTWGDFEMKYPEIDDVCPTDWTPLYAAICFVNESSSSGFANDVDKYFDFPMLVDYYIFNAVLASTDHAGNNNMWAFYDIQQTQPMATPAIWDFDTTLGQTWDEEDIHSSTAPETGDFSDVTDAASLYLFYRLLNDDAAEFLDEVSRRYWELRPAVFSADSLAARFNGYFDMLRASGTLAREEARWSGDTDISGLPLDFAYEQAYIDDFIRRHIAYLDGLFASEAGIHSVRPNTLAVNPARFNLCGQRVKEGYKGIVISGGRKVLVK